MWQWAWAASALRWKTRSRSPLTPSPAKSPRIFCSSPTWVQFSLTMASASTNADAPWICFKQMRSSCISIHCRKPFRPAAIQILPAWQRRLAGICKKLEVPVIVKEVGWGISERTARILAECGVAAIDVAGAGGTSWSQVEMHRAPDDFTRQLAATFVDWGIPTADSILNVRKAAPGMTIFASGGLKDGLDIAKCIALGATLGGFAGQFLKAAAISTEKVT